MLAYDRYLAAHPDLFVRATSVADVDEARRSGRLAVFYLYQNTIQFGEDLDRIDMFYRLGLRSCQLTYNERNFVGVGCRALMSTGLPDEGGLTDFGRETIDRMNAIGMLVDVSHGERADDGRGDRSLRRADPQLAHRLRRPLSAHTGT